MKKRYLIIMFLVIFLGFKKNVFAYSFKSVEGGYTGSDVLYCGPYYSLEKPAMNDQGHVEAIFLKFVYASNSYYVYALDLHNGKVRNDDDGLKKATTKSGDEYTPPFCKSSCPLYIAPKSELKDWEQDQYDGLNIGDIGSLEFNILEKKSSADKQVFTYITDDMMLKCRYYDYLSLFYYNHDDISLIIPDYTGNKNYTFDEDLANGWTNNGVQISDTKWMNKYGSAKREKRCPSLSGDLENMANLNVNSFDYDIKNFIDRSDWGIDYCQNKPTSVCKFYNEYLDEIKELYISANNCDKSKDEYCDVPYILKADEYVSSIVEECSHLYSIIDSDSVCAKKCLNFNEDLKKLKDDYGIKSEEGACSLSSRVIKFIANILKWIKYIAPVLVILLGILDFIKAISAQNDDEMKKAQGKFVKRLIAAALLFLLPFIIQFILERFNMANNNPYCNLL